MKVKTIRKLREAQEYCDYNEKSTGYMIEYMKDFAGVDHDCVMNFLTTRGSFKPISQNKAKRIKRGEKL